MTTNTCDRARIFSASAFILRRIVGSSTAGSFIQPRKSFPFPVPVIKDLWRDTSAVSFCSILSLPAKEIALLISIFIGFLFVPDGRRKYYFEGNIQKKMCPPRRTHFTQS